MRPKINSMEENNVVADDSKTAEEITLDVIEETTTQDENVDVEEVKSKLAKAEELANNYKIRAEKAERLAKETKQIKPEVKQVSNVSTQDVMALMKANVQEEDIPEIEDYAKFKKISISEALKSNTIKTFLAESQEKRNTSNATNTGNAKRSPAKITDNEIIEKAQKGQEVDTEKLVEARWNLKKAKLKR